MDKIIEQQDNAAMDEAQRVAHELSEPRESPSKALGEQVTSIRPQRQLEQEIEQLRAELEEARKAIPELVQRINQSEANELLAWRELHNMRAHFAASQQRIQELESQGNHSH